MITKLLKLKRGDKFSFVTRRGGGVTKIATRVWVFAYRKGMQGFYHDVGKKALKNVFIGKEVKIK